jgi:hypothetical protein
MRTREEIYKDAIAGKVFTSGFSIILELLLDIRDLLNSKVTTEERQKQVH